MKIKSLTNNKSIIKDHRIKNISHIGSSMVSKAETNPVFVKLAEEGQEDFYNYIDWLGLTNHPDDFLILTSSHHYYFENEDFKTIKTVVNLKQLNEISKIEEFLQTIHSLIPQKCFFIGSFTSDKNQKGIFSSSGKSQYAIAEGLAETERETGRWNSFLNLVNNITSKGTNRYMTETSLRLLLESTGFKILDITDFNGLTYFCSQKNKSSAE